MEQTMEKEIELKVLPEHQAKGVLELCYKNLANIDTNFVINKDYGNNVSWGERREFLLNFRANSEKALKKLEETADNGLDAMKRAVILEKVTGIMNVVSMIDKNSVEHTMSLMKKHPDPFTYSIAEYTVGFPLTFEGEEKIVMCGVYEDLSLNNEAYAKFCEADSEEEQVKIIKEHVKFANVALVNNPMDEEAPVFAHIDPCIELIEPTNEVDK